MEILLSLKIEILHIQSPLIHTLTGMSTDIDALLTQITRTTETLATDEITTTLLLTNSDGRSMICGAQSTAVEATKVYMTSRLMEVVLAV